MQTQSKQQFITVGFIGEADIDTEATPEKTFESLFDVQVLDLQHS